MHTRQISEIKSSTVFQPVFQTSKKIFCSLSFPLKLVQFRVTYRKRSGGSQPPKSESEIVLYEAPARFKDDFSDLFLATWLPISSVNFRNYFPQWSSHFLDFSGQFLATIFVRRRVFRKKSAEMLFNEKISKNNTLEKLNPRLLENNTIFYCVMFI